MVLLLDKEDQSVLDILACLLYAKLHDINWEVRDSALEVIYTVVDISRQGIS